MKENRYAHFSCSFFMTFQMNSTKVIPGAEVDIGVLGHAFLLAKEFRTKRALGVTIEEYLCILRESIRRAVKIIHTIVFNVNKILHEALHTILSGIEYEGVLY